MMWFITASIAIPWFLAILFFRWWLQGTKEATLLNNAIKSAMELNISQGALLIEVKASLSHAEAKIREFSNLDRCYSSDGTICGWHNAGLKSGNCPISNKRIWNGERKKYKPQGRVTGSQYTRGLEARAAMEE